MGEEVGGRTEGRVGGGGLLRVYLYLPTGCRVGIDGLGLPPYLYHWGNSTITMTYYRITSEV